MNWKIVHIDETDSTNRWLREHHSNATLSKREQQRDGSQDAVAVVADYQTAGRGQGDNRWESERGKNLLFSLLIHPEGIPANKQFFISMAVSLAIMEALGQHIGDLSIKWPNDIYWRNGKIGGILIEHTLHGLMIRDSIIGVGLNINQRTFRSDAPNPVSLWQICEHETDREQLLQDILHYFEKYLTEQELKGLYIPQLYRRKGFHPYADEQGAFMAEIVDVEDDGHLLLRDESGCMRRYAFKEVTFII